MSFVQHDTLYDVERKSSAATTLCSPSVQGFTKASTVSSRRSSSTPLADRFMSFNYATEVTNQEEKIIIEIEAADNTTPEYSSQNDRLLLTPPPLFLPSPEPIESSSVEEEDEDHLPLKKPPPRKKKSPHHCCCSKNTSYPSNKCSKTHNHMWEGQEQKKKKNPNRVQPVVMNNTTAIEMEKATIQEPPRKWLRGGCCFVRKEGGRGHCFFFCGRREWVMITFISVILSFVLAFIFWPRIPLIRIEGAMMTVPTNKVTQTQHGTERMMMSNVAFESVWLLNITMDNRRNYLSTRFNRIQIIAKDALTGLLIGKGQPDGNSDIYIPGQTISTIQLPISVNYQARDRSDTTFSNLLRACTNTTEIQQHHSLSIQFWFTLYIFGLDWLGYKPSVIATPATGGFFCPS
ncbi:uncharacterized protein EV154DRAFT_127956 [Mucor mucedo]|uniref:uncharacterized protein n=1 Tax=Mucor mucedo TaxID=29922 RepID=UPI00221F36DB|nr:uncharacterized protein EV154DRAFT_127956 [Mucor mucedo]KAI7869810.1 hypothetical protein EV154DRAFT_127956 [Mucor mucedo]